MVKLFCLHDVLLRNEIMIVEPFETWPSSTKPASKAATGPTKEQLDRWTAAYAVPDAVGLGAPVAAAQKTADSAARSLDTRPVVGHGSAGADILDMQYKLDALGFDLGKADGIYGPKTETAVRAFQESQGITVDGIIGPETRQKLDALQNPNEAIDAGSLDSLVRFNPHGAADAGSLDPMIRVIPEGAGQLDPDENVLTDSEPNSGGSELPGRMEVIRAGQTASVGPFAEGQEVIYEIEYLPDGNALVTRRVENGAGITGSWRVGGFVTVGDHGEAGGYLGAGAQVLIEGINGDTFRVPADQARDLVRADAAFFTGVESNPIGKFADFALGLDSPLEKDGTRVGAFNGLGVDSQADALAFIGVTDADWLGPFEDVFPGAGGELGFSHATTTHQDLETGESRVRVDFVSSGALDASFLEIQDNTREDQPTVFGVDEDNEFQSARFLEIVSNDQGEVVEVVYGTTESNGETLERKQWSLDATDPALTNQIQTAMSGREGSYGNIFRLEELAQAEGEQQSQTYQVSSADYGVGGDFSPIPFVGVGGSAVVTVESYETA